MQDGTIEKNIYKLKKCFRCFKKVGQDFKQLVLPNENELIHVALCNDCSNKYSERKC